MTCRSNLEITRSEHAFEKSIKSGKTKSREWSSPSRFIFFWQIHSVNELSPEIGELLHWSGSESGLIRIETKLISDVAFHFVVNVKSADVAFTFPSIYTLLPSFLFSLFLNFFLKLDYLLINVASIETQTCYPYGHTHGIQIRLETKLEMQAWVKP